MKDKQEEIRKLIEKIEKSETIIRIENLIIEECKRKLQKLEPRVPVENSFKIKDHA